MLVDFWAILVFAIIIILFFILYSFNKSADEKAVETEFETKDANFILQAFLRAPAVGINAPDSTIADIIMKDSTTGDFTYTEQLFNKYFEGMTGYNVYMHIKGTYGTRLRKRMGISIIDRIDYIVTTNTPLFVGWGDTYSAETYIPGYEDKVYVMLRIDESTDMNNAKVTQ